MARWGRLSWHADPQPDRKSRSERARGIRHGPTRLERLVGPDEGRRRIDHQKSERALSAVASGVSVGQRRHADNRFGIAPTFRRTRRQCPQHQRDDAGQTRFSAKRRHRATSAAANTAFSITVTDTGDTPQTSSGTPTQTLLHGPQQQTQISWQADDPDRDRLMYTLYFRGEERAGVEAAARESVRKYAHARFRHPRRWALLLSRDRVRPAIESG